MSRLHVVDTAENAKVPFLRGILTRSLTDSGLPFEDSYRLASEIRQELTRGDVEAEITVDALRTLVAEHLGTYGQEAVDRYLHTSRVSYIQVKDRHGHYTPYSRGRHRLSLMASGLNAEEAAQVVLTMYELLVDEGVKEIDSRHLGLLTYRRLESDLGEAAAKRYLLLAQYRNDDRPLLVLIGGTAGCGKSTIATEVAHLLEIVRTQSTDMLREVMRMMVPERLIPVLHTSSFRAWEALPARVGAGPEQNGLMEEGYLAQVELLSVACEAVTQRALKERVSLVLEGIHVHPSLLQRIPEETDAIVVPMMLAVLKQTLLRTRIKGRGQRVPERRAKRYIENFESIWGLQSFLLSEADQARVPIISNGDKDSAVIQAVQTILEAFANHFDGTPEAVFR